MVAGPDAAGQISDLQRAFNELEDRIKSGTATAEDAEEVQRALGAVIRLTGIEATNMAAGLNIMVGSLDSASDAAARAAASIAAATSQFAAMEAMRRSVAKTEQDQSLLGGRFVDDLERRNSLTEERIRLEDEAARIQADAARAGVAMGAAEAERHAANAVAADERGPLRPRRRAGAAGKGGATRRQGSRARARGGGQADRGAAIRAVADRPDQLWRRRS